MFATAKKQTDILTAYPFHLGGGRRGGPAASPRAPLVSFTCPGTGTLRTLHRCADFAGLGRGSPTQASEESQATPESQDLYTACAYYR